jgi:hypothetical protein
MPLQRAWPASLPHRECVTIRVAGHAAEWRSVGRQGCSADDDELTDSCSRPLPPCLGSLFALKQVRLRGRDVTDADAWPAF